MTAAEQVIAILSRHLPSQEAVRELVRDLYMNVDSGDETFADVTEALYFKGATHGQDV